MNRVVLACAVGAAAALSSGAARAQSNADATRADASFSAGKRLLEQGDLAEACAHFAESKRLSPAVGVTLYLADCYQRLGRTASAWAEFQSAESLARAKNDKRAELARLRAHALEPKLERLTVHVPSSSAPEVSLDGRTLPPEAWEVPTPLDPGDHVVVARLGSRRREYDVHLDADDPQAEVTVEPMADAAAPAAHAPPAPPPAAPAPPPETAVAAPEAEAPQATTDSTRLWTAIGLFGVGVVGVGIGTVFGVKAISDHNASNDGPCNAADQCSARGLSLRDDAIDEARLSTVAFIAGAAGLGAAAVVTFLLPTTGSNTVAVSAVPLAGGGAALVRTSF
jgi:hypothetical protein